MQTILTAQSIHKSFDQEQVLKGISAEIHAGAFTAILGPSGSGKSTLLGILSGLIRPTDGKVLHNGVDITALSEGALADWKRENAGNVFQNYLLLNNLTAEENIKIGLIPRRTSLDFGQLVEMLGIDSILSKFPSQLSGGEQQRVAIARAVIKRPALLFCDEATGALDEANSKRIVELLHELKSAFGIAVLFTTHNQQIAQTADRVLTIKNGLLHRDAVNEHPLAAADMVWG